MFILHSLERVGLVLWFKILFKDTIRSKTVEIYHYFLVCIHSTIPEKHQLFLIINIPMKGKNPNKPLDHIITIRVNSELFSYLKMISKQHSTTPSVLVREVLYNFLHTYDKRDFIY